MNFEHFEPTNPDFFAQTPGEGEAFLGLRVVQRPMLQIGKASKKKIKARRSRPLLSVGAHLQHFLHSLGLLHE